MELSYASRRLEKIFNSDKELIRAYGSRAKKIRQRKIELEEALALDTIAKLPALRLHPMHGDRKGQWSIDILKNWRIFFTINQKPIPCLMDGGVDLSLVTKITIVEVEDPH